MPIFGRCLAVALAAVALAVGVQPANATTSSAKIHALRSSIASNRHATWAWQSVALLPKTRTVYAENRTRSLTYLKWNQRLWHQRLLAARWRAQHPPHLAAWLCIHHYEGAWNDPGAPYYGGLQMDRSFMESYGAALLKRKGTADHWSPLEQIWVAERAYESGRGFYPWPNTARWCHLI